MRSHDRSDDGTPVGFARRRRSWGACEAPGEHSLALGTPGLHDASPLGLRWPVVSINAMRLIEPPRGSVMQPKGAEPQRGSLGNQMPPPLPGLRTATRSRQARREVTRPFE